MTKRSFQIYRYDPDRHDRPQMQHVDIALDGIERMLLDALMVLEAHAAISSGTATNTAVTSRAMYRR